MKSDFRIALEQYVAGDPDAANVLSVLIRAHADVQFGAKGQELIAARDFAGLASEYLLLDPDRFLPLDGIVTADDGRELPLLLCFGGQQLFHFLPAATGDGTQNGSHPSNSGLNQTEGDGGLVVLRGSIRVDTDELTERRVRKYRRVLGKPLPLGLLPAPAVLEDIAERFPWMSEPLQVIRNHLTLGTKFGATIAPMPPLLLVGPPGIGKTRFLRELATALAREAYIEPMAGVSEAFSIAGGVRGFKSTDASLPARAVLATRTADPVVILDELDKVGSSDWNGHPHGALLPFLERETARSARDRFLDAELDVSHVWWLGTANRIESVATPLRDRFTVCEVGRPSADAARCILGSFRTDLAAEFGVDLAQIPDLPSSVLGRLIEPFAHHGDIRRLQRDWRTALVRPELRAVSAKLSQY